MARNRALALHIACGAAAVCLGGVLAGAAHADPAGGFQNPEPPASPSPSPSPPSDQDLTTLTLDELAAIEVSTVTRKAETLLRTPAAVFVITAQDIRRAGATTLPDALRLAPGVQVSRIDASHWAVGVRGFASSLTRSLLVLVDGRSVYTPLFAGTYWDVQDVVLEDIERIEVIRGPGGTLWSANAVNGVINIITKSSRDTQGRLLRAEAGNQERFVGAARWGFRAGARGHLRAWGKFSDRAAEFHPDGDAFDAWHMTRGGFRGDFDLGHGSFTVDGDLYGGRTGQRTVIASYAPPFRLVAQRDAELGGGHLRGRWHGTVGRDGDLSVQAYYDRTHRDEANFREDRDTGDVDVQYHRPIPLGQDMLAGFGYRISRGRSSAVETVVFHPPDRTDHVVSGFVQDQIRAIPGRVDLTLGLKLERNDYSGVEFQPSARVLWTIGPRHVAWAAVSRAVRTPSRVERDLELTFPLDGEAPLFGRLLGDRKFESEEVVAYEAGYRFRTSSRLLIDLATFHEDLSHLLSLEPGDPFTETGPAGARLIAPLTIANGLQGDLSGFEVSADVRLAEPWAFEGSYSYLRMDLEPAAGSLDTTQAAAGASPRHILRLRSSFSRGAFRADAGIRHVSRLPTQGVPAFTEADARLAWRPRDGLELALDGRDLLHAHHAEFGGGVEVERRLLAEITWRF